MNDDIAGARRLRMNAELRECSYPGCPSRADALEAVQQTPAVDTGKAARAIWEVFWPGTSDVMDDAELGAERAQVARILFSLTASGVLLDAAGVWSEGHESAMWNSRFPSERRPNPYRAQQVRGGN